MSRQQTTAFKGIQHDMSLRHDYKLPEKVVDIHTSVWYYLEVVAEEVRHQQPKRS